MRNTGAPAVLLPVFLLLAFTSAKAQDERRVVSPDGQLEFKLFVAPQEDRALSRVAYTVAYKGKLVVPTSYLGLDIWDQEPLLGENAGLISCFTAPYSLIAHYMQNGSLGRLLNIEVRVFNEGVAFRYHVPKSLLLEDLMIADEATEFALPHDGVTISEILTHGFPPMHLSPEGLTRLARNGANPKIAYQGKTPFIGPWRIISIGTAPSKFLGDLKQ